MAHTLYRMFDRDGLLLYVGISKHAIRRFDQHGREKQWWTAVDRITVEHFPSRAALEHAERVAIRSEAPMHNKQRYGAPTGAPRRHAGDQYAFTSVRGRTSIGRGSLRWEVSCDPISDDWLPEEISAGELFMRWLAYVENRGHVDAMGYVPIYWSVNGPGIFEAALPDPKYPDMGHYAKFYLPPICVATGRHVDILDLPVEDKLWRMGCADKGGFIQELTGWKPAPLQDSVSLAMLKRLAMARDGATC